MKNIVLVEQTERICNGCHILPLAAFHQRGRCRNRLASLHCRILTFVVVILEISIVKVIMLRRFDVVLRIRESKPKLPKTKHTFLKVLMLENPRALHSAL